MITSVITGAAGFAGCNLTEKLVESGRKVICIERPGSAHNERLERIRIDAAERRANGEVSIGELIRVPLDMTEYHHISEKIEEQTGIRKCEEFYHLSWVGGRDDFEGQMKNIKPALDAVKEAAALRCRRILMIGSQAEYGYSSGAENGVTEDMKPDPFSAYGASKAAALYLTKRLAEQLDVEWIWGRIFSLYGKYERKETMLRYVISCLEKGETPKLSSCMQTWDYLDAGDAADAMMALMARGHAGEIYNIADGRYRPLKEFVEIIRERINPDADIQYGDAGTGQIVSLRPSVAKIQEDTGWKPLVEFPSESLFKPSTAGV